MCIYVYILYLCRPYGGNLVQVCGHWTCCEYIYAFLHMYIHVYAYTFIYDIYMYAP